MPSAVSAARAATSKTAVPNGIRRRSPSRATRPLRLKVMRTAVSPSMRMLSRKVRASVSLMAEVRPEPRSRFMNSSPQTSVQTGSVEIA